jgi:hypothetical protein
VSCPGLRFEIYSHSMVPDAGADVSDVSSPLGRLAFAFQQAVR